MEAKNLTGKISDVLDTAKTGLELASNINECCDPSNKNKTKSIVGIVGNGLLMGCKIRGVFTGIANNRDFKLQINSSLLMLKGYVNGDNPFYIDTYNTFHNIDRDGFDQIIHDYESKIKMEYPNDVRVQTFWNFITGNVNEVIREEEFNYAVSKIRELDCKMIRSNNSHLNREYVEQVLVSTYSSFADDVFKGLKSELRRLDRISDYSHRVNAVGLKIIK